MSKKCFSVNPILSEAERDLNPALQAEILDWIELTEAISLLDEESLRNWLTALNERFSDDPVRKMDLWNRLSVGCKKSLQSVRGAS
jgi:hypothetical protein